MELVLASGSPYRAQVLRDAGYDVVVDPPGIDERVLDHLFVDAGPDALALELARRKAATVAPRHPGVPTVAGDQVGVLETGQGLRMLTKATTVEAACDQLMAMSGTRHRLVNGVVVALVDADGTEVTVEGVDVQVVSMADYGAQEARRYVEDHEPFDTAGSYRLEDDAGLVASVEGEHESGVLGMPLPLLQRLLDDLEPLRAQSGRSTPSRRR